MFQHMRQRRIDGTAGSAPVATPCQIPFADSNPKKSSNPSLGRTSAQTSSRNSNKKYYNVATVLFLVLTVSPILLFGPELCRLPQALWVYAKGGFRLDDLLGPGVSLIVQSMLRRDHPRNLIFWKDMADLEQTPSRLAAMKDVIMEEYQSFVQTHRIPTMGEMDPEEQGPLDPQSLWKTIFLRTHNQDTCAAKLFLGTMKAVDTSGMVAYSVLISRMAPGQRIEPHVGFTKVVQVYHLALKVPSDEAGPKPFLEVQECDDFQHDSKGVLVVDKQKCPRIERYEWKAGQEMIFDDSFPHWAENPSSEERLVIILFVARNDYKGWRERLVAHLFYTIFSWIPYAPAVRLAKGMEKACFSSIQVVS